LWLVCRNCGQIVKTNSKTGRKCPKCDKFIDLKKAVKSDKKLINKEAKKIEFSNRSVAEAF